MDNTEQRDFAEEAANLRLLHEEDEPGYSYEDYLRDIPDGTPEGYERHMSRISDKRPPKVHIFTSDSGRAYDTTQTEDSIRDGDVLIVPSEGIVGIMVQAWPSALTSQNGHFHRLDLDHPETDKYEESVILAESYIRSEPYHTYENGQQVRKQYDTLNEDELRERHNIHI